MSTLTNARWTAVSQFSRSAAYLVGAVVLARLVAPEEYGRVAMAKVVITFTNIFREMGTSAALIKKRELTNRTTTAVFWFNLSAGCLVAIIVGAVAPLTARGFRTEALTAVT